MTIEEPLFMINKEWYMLNQKKQGFDDSEPTWVLTDKAPQEAIQSYYDFYKAIESTDI